MKIIIAFACLLVAACAPVDGGGFESLFGEDTVSKEDRKTWQMSQRSTDPSTCATITTSKNFHDGCYENIAINNKDVSLCDNVHRNPDFCKSDYASETGDYSVCGTLGTENHRSHCYARIGKDTYNAALCAEVEKTSTRDDCYISVSYGSDDPKICESIEEASSAKNRCFSAMAVKIQDATYCYYIDSDLYDQDKCIVDVGILKADFDLCETVKGDHRDRCVDGVYDKCRELRNKTPTKIPYYCQEGVKSPAGVPMTYS